jgi:hypothetical protein
MKTVRWRSGQIFVGLVASLPRGDINQHAQNVAEVDVQWESQSLTLSNGTRIASGSILWLPETRVVQPSTDGFVLGDAPTLPDPHRQIATCAHCATTLVCRSRISRRLLLSRWLQPAAGRVTLGQRPRRPPSTRA